MNRKNNEKTPWVVVAGGVHRHGGTDKANFALVEYLLRREIPVHVVTHHIDQVLLNSPTIRVEVVPIPGKSTFAGEKLLALRGGQIVRRTLRKYPGARIVVNGGNCVAPDINWVHRVHHAWAPETVNAPWIHRLKHRMAVASARRRELRSLRTARLIIANSELTRSHLIELIRIDPGFVETVYLGAESDWVPPLPSGRLASRARFEQHGRPIVVFIGAIGYDNNKGMDTLLNAWGQLCQNRDWDADLLIAGDGRALRGWQAMVDKSDFRHRVRFLGFTEEVRELLAAADLLVSPVRYESYGLNVQEALCRGVPAIVSANAGIAERYPSRLRDLLLPNPEDVGDLVNRLLMWRSAIDYWRDRVIEFSKELRVYNWQKMAERFYWLATRNTEQITEGERVESLAGISQ